MPQHKFTQEQVERIFRDAMNLTTQEMTEVSPIRTMAMEILETRDEVRMLDLAEMGVKLAEMVVNE